MRKRHWFASSFVTALLLISLGRMFTSGIGPSAPDDLITFEEKEVEDINSLCLDVLHCQQILERNRYWLMRGKLSEDALEEVLLKLEAARTRAQRNLTAARYRTWEE